MHKFAIIGCGATGLLHSEKISRLGKLVAVCDVAAANTEAIARTHEAGIYSSADEMLAAEHDVSIVCLCTPTGFHAEHAIKSLQAGKHVIIESPVCLTTAGAWQLMETEKYSRKKAVVVNFIRTNSLLQELRKQVEENEWGRIKNFVLTGHVQRPEPELSGWRGKSFPAGGPLYTEWCQQFQLIALLFGDLEKAEGNVLHKRHDRIMEVEDEGTARLKMKNGITGQVYWTINHPEEKPRTHLSISTENGTIQLDDSYFRPDYEKFYEQLPQVLSKDRSPSQVFDAWKAVELIEKIYQAVSLNPS